MWGGADTRGRGSFSLQPHVIEGRLKVKVSPTSGHYPLIPGHALHIGVFFFVLCSAYGGVENQDGGFYLFSTLTST